MNLRPAICSAALAAALLPTGASARPDVIDLRDEANVTIVSARPMDHAGWNSAAAGDVNGDGIDDVIVGAPGADGPDRVDAGAAYVVFGRRTKAQVRRASLTARGFRVLGPAADVGAGTSVAPAGDVDGDGLDDVVIGSNGGTSRPDGTRTAGVAWIVHGQRGGATIDLATPSSAVTTLTGPPTFGQLVAGGRDVDGDRRPDVAVAAPIPFVSPGADREDAGVFVVPGGTAGSMIDVRRLDRGIVVRGVAAWARTDGPDGWLDALTLVQDMNGDGRAELGLGFLPVRGTAGDPPRTSTTLARVVYGRAAPASVDLRQDFGAAGFVVRAPGGRHGLGSGALSGDGDVNGDGRGDLALGEPLVGRVRVLFGGALTGSVDVETAAGLTVTDPSRRSQLGLGAAIVGDVDGDGLDDVLAGDSGTTVRGRFHAGAAYLVHGSRSPMRVGVGHLGMHGFAMVGAHQGDSVGRALASAGDFNGDGRDDLLLGASSHHELDGRGVAHIVYGSGRPR